ncbi:hypothetical protein KQ302_11770, partial [Synechococcus sp. CS-602]|uniref:hypothetical protein n=1 Tax=unclassified Synechococcus TaxID=2626047 RepID=UPI0021A7EC5B
VELNKLGQRQAGLELDPIHSHGSDDWYMRTSLGPKRAACGACCLIKLPKDFTSTSVPKKR